MKIPWEQLPLSSFIKALRLGMDATLESDTPVRVAVYVDATAPHGMVAAVRDAFVPQTTSALVRVERLAPEPVPPKADTDVVLVLTSGSDVLEDAVQRLVIGGAPVCVVAESSVEAPFIEADTPLLGLICASDPAHLRDALARWILDRTDKDSAFAANFPFMREAAANRIVTTTALANMATGVLVFMPGSNFPVMAFAEAGMALKLASTYGYRMRPERGYEIAGVLVSGLVLRGISRAVCGQVPRLAFVVKGLIGGFGTYGMGMALAALYARGLDYERLNEILGEAFSGARTVVRRGATVARQAADAASNAGTGAVSAVASVRSAGVEGRA